ncbi:MAG: CpaF family protein [Haloechinothrix sp.]
MTGEATAYEVISRDALARIEHRRIEPVADGEAVRTAVRVAVEEYQRVAHVGEARALKSPAEMVERVLRSISEFGPLTELLANPRVEQIFIEGPRVSYQDASGRLRALNQPTTEEEMRHVVERLLASTGRHLDARSPLVQARVLEDSEWGRARLTATIRPISDQLSAHIRKYVLRHETLRSLVERGSLSPQAASFLWALMQTRSRTVASGPPYAGKTTLLGALLAAVPPTRCIRCCEESRELAVPLTHGSYYEQRPPALDGTGAVSLRDLVKFVLATSPDLIVVGEVRSAEAWELARAVNAGCGFAVTVHANSARDALTALVNMALMAGENVTERVVRTVFASAIDFVVHLELDERKRQRADGAARRQVMEILEVVPSLSKDGFTTEPIFAREGLGKPLEWTGAAPASAGVIDRALPEDVSVRSILEGRRTPL